MKLASLCALILQLLLITPIRAGKKTNPARVPKNAVLLSNISSLTLRADKVTSSRRVSPIPQLTCIGPNDVCRLYKVDVMRCKNEGADYDADNIQWSCKASLPEEFKLGSTDVICEGYESSDDPYVLKGSCGVEYRLLLTDKGEARYRTGRRKYGSYGDERESDTGGSRIGGAIFMVIFLGVLFIIFRNIWSASTRNPPRLGRGRGFYGGDDNDDPPPPYDGPPGYSNTPRKQKSTQSRNTSSTASSSRPRNQQQEGWRPGFWTGAATGAAAGYAARSMQNRTQQQSQMQEQTRSAASSFGNLGSSSSFSGQRHESTGFGGTQRR